MASRYYETNRSGEEIKPGRISAELRAALNLAENDLPIWIYRMRALGYPPGWLSKATVDTSDIFDTDSSPNDSLKRKEQSDIEYDVSKLIEYPGFNAPMPPNTNDYHYYYNMPAMLPHQQLDYAKQNMKVFTPTPVPKRARISAESSAANSLRNNNESFNSLANTTASGADTSANVCELEDPASPDPEEGDSPKATPADEKEESPSSTSTSDETSKQPGKQIESSSAQNQSSSTAVKSNLSASLLEEIKLVSKGSPLAKPVERMPLEKFSEGVVGELLFFENTPNSSGKFDSIRNLLDAIRK